MNETIAAKYITDMLPDAIRIQLINNEKFCNKFKLRPLVTLHLGSQLDIEQEVFLLATMDSIRGVDSVFVNAGEGLEVKVSVSESRIIFRRNAEESSINFRFDEFYLFSHDFAERRRAYEYVVETVGPTSNYCFDLEDIVTTRPVSISEMGLVLDDMVNGYRAVIGRITESIRNGEVSVDKIIPDDIQYYEFMIGEVADSSEPETYLQKSLKEYMQLLVDRDLAAGVDICLLASLRDDISVAELVKNYDNNELWSVVRNYNNENNPYVLLGLLDVLLYRLSDKRYRNLAIDIVTTLCSNKIIRVEDGVDVYELLPLYVQLTLNQISSTRGGIDKPPFWKRLAAWVHGGQLLRQSKGYELKFDEMEAWVNANMDFSSQISNLFDLRKEPVFWAYKIDSATLRGEVLGRLRVMMERHRKIGNDVEILSCVKTLFDGEEGPSNFLSSMAPGPLEGHLLPKEMPEKSYPDDQVEDAINQLQLSEDKSAWTMLAYVSQIFALPPVLFDEIKKSIASYDPSLQSSHDRLGDLSLVAIINRDVELSELIIECVFNNCGVISDVDELNRIVNIVITASAACQGDLEWAKWFSDKITHIAKLVKFGQVSRNYLNILHAIKMVTPVDLHAVAKAEAFAKSAY